MSAIILNTCTQVLQKMQQFAESMDADGNRRPPNVTSGDERASTSSHRQFPFVPPRLAAGIQLLPQEFTWSLRPSPSNGNTPPSGYSKNHQRPSKPPAPARFKQPQMSPSSSAGQPPPENLPLQSSYSHSTGPSSSLGPNPAISPGALPPARPYQNQAQPGPFPTFNPCFCCGSCDCSLRCCCIVIALLTLVVGPSSLVDIVSIPTEEKCQQTLEKRCMDNGHNLPYCNYITSAWGNTILPKCQNMILASEVTLLMYITLAFVGAICLLLAVFMRSAFAAMCAAVLTFLSAVVYIFMQTMKYNLASEDLLVFANQNVQQNSSGNNVYDVNSDPAYYVLDAILRSILLAYFGICCVGFYTQIRAGTDQEPMQRFPQVGINIEVSGNMNNVSPPASSTSTSSPPGPLGFHFPLGNDNNNNSGLSDVRNHTRINIPTAPAYENSYPPPPAYEDVMGSGQGGRIFSWNNVI